MNNPLEMSLQEKFAPNSICFGCGPKNLKGLRVRSYPVSWVGVGQENSQIRRLDDLVSGPFEMVVAWWIPQDFYEAFSGILNGGIIGAILDCHSNWTAAWTLKCVRKLDQPPCTVTADFAVKLLRPTPTAGEIFLSAGPVEVKEDRVVVTSYLMAGDKKCATFSGAFVAVKPGHPAYHRW